MSMGETYEDSGSEDVSAFSVSVCVPLCVCGGGGRVHIHVIMVPKALLTQISDLGTRS